MLKLRLSLSPALSPIHARIQDGKEVRDVVLRPTMTCPAELNGHEFEHTDSS